MWTAKQALRLQSVWARASSDGLDATREPWLDRVSETLMKCHLRMVALVWFFAISSGVTGFAQLPFTEFGVNTLPIDLAVTPSGETGGVRGADDPNSGDTEWITFYNLSKGLKVLAQGCPPTPWGRHYAGKAVSDLIVCDNAFFATIGGIGQTVPTDQDTTYVDFFTIQYSGTEPPDITMQCQANHSVFSADPLMKAGNAHDIAVSPNGARVVVNHRNWIHVYSAPSGAQLAAINVGSFGPNPSPTDPLVAVDSIAITDTRAVVITNRGQIGGRTTYVYVIDLVAPTPNIVFDHLIGGSGGDQNAHDIAISPNGRKAMVSSNGVAALINLQNNSILREYVALLHLEWVTAGAVRG
jgi:hypothetical protein